MRSPSAFTGDYPEIREAVARLCEDFPGEYWRDLDRDRAYPTAFVEALTEVAKAENLKDFNVIMSHDDGSGQPITEYTGIPNDRKFYHRKTICSGCKWWLNHYVGAITADKLDQQLLDELHRLRHASKRAFQDQALATAPLSPLACGGAHVRL